MKIYFLILAILLTGCAFVVVHMPYKPQKDNLKIITNTVYYSDIEQRELNLINKVRSNYE